MTSRTQFLDFSGRRLAYRVAGAGPALVVLNGYARARDMVQARVLSDTWRVFQLWPLGYGFSDRRGGHSGEDLPTQIEAVLDAHGAQRFVVWGDSQRGAMAACVALGSARAAGWICGGYAPHDVLTAGVMRRLDRRLPPDDPSRTVWAWVRSIDWHQALHTMRCPGLLYWGSDDRQMARGLRRTRDQLTLLDAPKNLDFVEFPGLEHGSFDDTVLVESVVPVVRAWAAQRLGSVW